LYHGVGDSIFLSLTLFFFQVNTVRERIKEKTGKGKTNLENLFKPQSPSTEKKKFPQFGLSPIQLQSQNPGQPDGVPLLVSKCVKKIEEEGLEEEGLFRVTGSRPSINATKSAFEAGETDLAQCNSIYDVCGVLGDFFRELPEPLLTWKLYDPLVESVKEPDLQKRLSNYRGVFNQLPAANYVLLKYFVAFLVKVEAHSDINKMTRENIGIVSFDRSFFSSYLFRFLPILCSHGKIS